MRGYTPPGHRRPAPVGPPLALPGRLFGVRKWHVRHDLAGSMRLGSLGHGQWRRGGETTWAQCRNARVSHPIDQRAPVGSCTCGLYAVHPWSIADPSLGIQPRADGISEVVGIVEAWGRVHVHAEGFRAQYARPVTLVSLGFRLDSGYGRLVEDLAGEHRAEVVELANRKALIDYCFDASLGLAPKAVEALIGEADPGPIRADWNVSSRANGPT